MRGMPAAVVACALAMTSCDAKGITLTSHDAGSGDTADPRTDIWTSGPVRLLWSWTIEGHPTSTVDYEELCAWAGYGHSTVRLLVDVDFDTTEDYYYDANCGWGTAETDPALDPADYSPGDDVWFAFQLLGYDGSVYAQSENYTEITLRPGTNDLGTVDFDFGDFGPLDVLVQWADREADPAYGDCDWPPDDVAVMGYLLQYSTGEVADEVDIDSDPMDCTTDLSWLETEFDTYDLIIDGDGATGTTVWGSTCAGLVVDDDVENAWQCDILMTSSP